MSAEVNAEETNSNDLSIKLVEDKELNCEALGQQEEANAISSDKSGGLPYQEILSQDQILKDRLDGLLANSNDHILFQLLSVRMGLGLSRDPIAFLTFVTIKILPPLLFMLCCRIGRIALLMFLLTVWLLAFDFWITKNFLGREAKKKTCRNVMENH